MLYRKKPVVIEAIEFTGLNCMEVAAFAEYDDVIDSMYPNGNPKEPETIQITTLEGVMTAMPGDYIIKGVQGELYPCKPDIFLATYELVEDLAMEPDPAQYSWRLTRENLFAEDSWINKYPNDLMLRSDSETGAFWIELTTSRGILHVAEGDYIIQADDGELNTVTEAEYEKLHERDVEDEQE